MSIIPLVTAGDAESTVWAKIAQALGYQLLATYRRDGSAYWGATLLRPDGNYAAMEMPEREARRLAQVLGARSEVGDG